MAFVARIRLSLADRAGALGQAATVIGLHGGNILSVDVHSTEGASAVDDLVVEFPSEPSSDELRSDLAMTAAATIVQMQETTPVDVVTAVLAALRPRARARSITGTDAAESGADCPELIDGLSAVCPSTEWSLVEREPEDLEEERDHAISDTRPLQLVIPIPGSARSVLARRTAAVHFTATEMARVDAVVSLWACMKEAVVNEADPKAVPDVDVGDSTSQALP